MDKNKTLSFHKTQGKSNYKKKKTKEKKKLDNFIKLNAGVPFGVSTFESTGCLMHIAHGAPSKQINV